MFFKLFKSDKSKAAEAPSDSSSSEQAVAEKPAEADGEPGLPLGAYMDSAGATVADSLGFNTTADLKPADGPLGQEKAIESIDFAAGIKGPGYHLLVVGPTGSGRRTVARARLQPAADKSARPSDWAYVSSFDPTGGFRALKLPSGTAKRFAEMMARAIDQLADALPAAFTADDYDLKRRTIEEEFRFSREDALESLRREAEAQNIALLRTPAGIAVAPVLEGKVVKTDVFNSVPEVLRREVETKIAALEAEIEAILTERPEAEKERRARLVALNEQVAGRHVRAALDEIKAEFAEVAGVESYLKAAARDLVRNAAMFVSGATGSSGAQAARVSASHPSFARYLVHVLATSSEGSGAPIIHEQNPTYANLFGRIELGTAADGSTQVVRIKHGALHRANGGFLLVDGDALIDSPAAADALRRALEADEIRFDPPAGPVGAVGDEVPDLEPIPLNLRLVVFANAGTQRRLAASFPGLRRLLKVEAVFDHAVDRTKETVDTFARIVAGVVDKQNLRPIDAAGVALLIDEAAHRAGSTRKLSLLIGDVIDVCREADHWADTEKRKSISAADVERALKQRRAINAAELAEAS